MKTILRPTLLLCVPLLLTACASSHSLTQNAPPAPTSSWASDQTITRDQQYISDVERIAKRRGVEVVWVNPPNRHLDKTASR